MIESKKEDDSSFEKIKVFSSEDEKLKLLGELLSNKSSRDIIKLLMNEEHYTNEIATKLDLRPNLVIHHLKKLKELGLLEITNKRIVKKGNEHRYFRINPNLFITPNHTKDEIEKKGIFQKIFKDGIKFIVIGVVSTVSYFLSFKEKVVDSDEYLPFSETPIANNENSYTIPLIVLIIGLGLLYLLEKRKKRKE